LRLRQVLTNLSTNSMKFTDEGSVTIAVELVELHPDDDYAAEEGMTVPHLLFRVRDTGIGMDESTMFSLFQRFYQGNRTMKRMVSDPLPHTHLSSPPSLSIFCLPSPQAPRTSNALAPLVAPFKSPISWQSRRSRTRGIG